MITDERTSGPRASRPCAAVTTGVSRYLWLLVGWRTGGLDAGSSAVERTLPFARLAITDLQRL